MSLDTDTAALAAGNGPLTIDQAVSIQMAKAAPVAEDNPETVDAEAPEAGGETVETESEAEPQTAEETEGEPTEANADGDEAEPPEPEQPAIEPPQFWDAEGKESFAKLSREAQEAVRGFEEQRTKAVAKAVQKSAEAKKHHEAVTGQLKAVSERIGTYVDAQAERMNLWPDHLAKIAEEAPEQFSAEQALYFKEKHAYDKALAEKAEADEALYAAHVTEQRRIHAEVAPELADPKEGKARWASTIEYVKSKGFGPEQIKWIGAQEAAIAYKAMRYDSVPDFDAVLRDAELYRKAKKVAEAPPAKPKPKPAGPVAAPAGQGQRPSSSEARLKTLSSKRNLSVDEHVELMSLKATVRK